MRILLIEDEAFVADFERRVLKGHEIVHAANLHDAFTAKMTSEFPGETPFELVVLDLKLPNPHRPGEFYDPIEVLKRVHETFEDIPIVAVSAFLDDDLIEQAGRFCIFCIDKTLVTETQSFLNLFNSLAGVSKQMRQQTTMLSHLTKDAILTIQDDKTSEMEKVKAKLYLAAGTTVILLPWLMIGYMMYARSVLKDNSPIPYYTETLLFCGVAIAAIIGILPWFLKFFGPKLP